MLTIKVLGQFDIRLDDQPIKVPTQSARSLFAYLLLNTDVTHRRAKLAGIFWPDTSESKARNNLRHALWRIRNAIGREYLLTDNVSVTFNRDADYWLDATVLETAFDKDMLADELMELVALYTGELLPGIYDDWVVLERDRLRAFLDHQNKHLLDKLAEQRRWVDILQWAERWISLGHTPETAYRALMAAHAASGNQASVVAVYRRCVDALRNDLDVDPSQETRTLFERLARDEGLTPDNVGTDSEESAAHVSQHEDTSTRPSVPSILPTFLNDEIESPRQEQRLFIGRERELSRLQGFLDDTLNGRGHVVFVTGSAGRGKTSLINEWIRRAQATYTDLIVASGQCNAYAGGGDPYLPFRDVIGMLSGDVEAKWMAGAITRQHAQRLWSIMPAAVQAIVDVGPDLIGAFIPRTVLLNSAKRAIHDGADALACLQNLAATSHGSSVDLEQSYLFEQYVNVLQQLAFRHPILITLDDLQWADTASVSLLFHLGRRIGVSRILIVGAYRPEEVAVGWDGDRHPLQKVLSELQRTYGENRVELAEFEENEGRRFVDALLDARPNRLGIEFRQDLFRRTAGHPLFTVELLQAMQTRGEMFLDEGGFWDTGPSLDWRLLPARVEAVIGERIGRLDDDMRRTLAVASVEGETFTAAVVAGVLGLDQLQLLRQLSQELAKNHRLVREHEESSVGRKLLARYSFTHILFQRYLYDGLGAGERRQLHGEMARVLERLHEGSTDEVAVQLLHHFREAGQPAKAFEYAQLAATLAEAVYAYDEAIQHLQSALELLEDGEQPEIRVALLEKLADVHVRTEQRARSALFYQAALEEQAALACPDEDLAIRLHRKILAAGAAMKSSDFEGLEALSPMLDLSRSVLEASIVRPETDLPELERIRALTTLADDAGIGLRVPLDLDRAQGYAQSAVDLATDFDAPIALSDALHALTKVYFARGMLPEQIEISRRRLALSSDPRFGDVDRRTLVMAEVSNDLILVGEFALAIRHLREVERVAVQIGAISRQVSALVGLARCLYHLDRWDELFGIYERCRYLQQRHPPEVMQGLCMVFALVAAVQALRGGFDQARALREEAYEIMVSGSGPPQNFTRTEHY